MSLNKSERYFLDNIVALSERGTIDENPRPKWKDGTPAHALYINAVYESYDLANGELPMTDVREIKLEKAFGEICWIFQNQTSNIQVLEEEYGVNWWRDWLVDEESIGIRYGETVKRYNMMNKILTNLLNDPFSRRHIMSLWQEQDFQDSEGLLPCAFLTMWSVSKRNGSDDMYLDMTLIQRSSDYLVAGHINKMQYVALQMMVAKHLGYKVGMFNHFVQCLHIYDRHLDQALEIISRLQVIKKRPTASQPKLILDVPDGTNFYDIKVSDFKIVDYDPIEPQIKFPLAI